MFFKKSEIEKVLKKYGDAKGALYLTIYHTYMKRIMPLMTSGNGDAAKEATNQFIANLKEKYGMPFVMEYNPFFQENMRNIKLQGELEKAGSQYYDESLFS